MSNSVELFFCSVCIYMFSESISNRSDISICMLCVCVCACVHACMRACMWNKRDIRAFETRFLFFRILHTNACTNASFRAVSLVKLHNLLHIDTTTTIQTIANTIMSTKLTDDTLQLFIVKSPISTMSIHIAFKFVSFEHNVPLVHPMRHVSTKLYKLRDVTTCKFSLKRPISVLV